MKKKIVLPNYQNSSANLVNSILKYYNCSNYHSTLPQVDKLLANKYQHIFLIILDGMGSCIIENNLPTESFLRKNKLFDYSAVYPCTTVAATTTLQSGLTPIQTGWIGWHQHFPELNEDVVLFLNTINATGTEAANFNVAEKYLPYQHICDLIGNNDSVSTSVIFPAFRPNGVNDFNELCQRVAMISKEDQDTFTYVYWTQPDATMHKYGCYSPETKAILADIDQELTVLAQQLNSDSLLLITPDHGMIDVEEIDLKDHPLLTACFYRQQTVEPRCNSFYVIDDKKEAFIKYFNENFKDFILYSKQEAFDKQLFGLGKPHAMINEMLGNYFGIAIGNRIIKHESDHEFVFKAHHAGLTADEMVIPLIAYHNISISLYDNLMK